MVKVEEKIQRGQPLKETVLGKHMPRLIERFEKGPFPTRKSMVDFLEKTHRYAQSSAQLAVTKFLKGHIITRTGVTPPAALIFKAAMLNPAAIRARLIEAGFQPIQPPARTRKDELELPLEYGGSRRETHDSRGPSNELEAQFDDPEAIMEAELAAERDLLEQKHPPRQPGPVIRSGADLLAAMRRRAAARKTPEA